MRTSIATVCLSGTLEEKLRAAATAGFDGVEIFEQDLVVNPMPPTAVRDLAAELGLSLDLYQPFRDFEGVDDRLLAANLRRAREKFALMGDLGIDTMLLCSNVSTATVADDDAAAEQLHRLGTIAHEFGINVAYEALAWGRFVSEYDHAWRIVSAAAHPRIGTCLDSFHILSRGTDLAGISAIPGGSIFFLQLADAPALDMDVLSWSRHHRVFPGEGAWDLADLLARVAATGYDGPVSLEVFNDSFRQADTDRIAVDGLRSLRWLEAGTAQRLSDSHVADSAPNRLGPSVDRVRLELETLPQVAEPAGFDFAEIGTDDLGTVTRTLHQLGLRFVGYHRSKPHVQLWTRGRARIIVTESPSEPASTAEPAVNPGHGTSLTGIGFAVTDAATAMSRAQLLHAAEVPRKQTHDDAVLRGVLAPDGSEVFFHTGDGITTSWSGEFGEYSDERDSAIDHVNLAQPVHHFDEAVLFYTSLLALHAEPSQEVPSPSGLVRSQVMTSSDGAVRMPLNVAPPTTARPGTRERTAGRAESYPEHIAISCDDIFAAAETARTRGLEFLTVPDNYYDDLDARFDIDLALLTRLRENHVLYDRDSSGGFFHFYTATIGSVFFEMIQRTGDYRGFGAANAPVRLAAQHRHGAR